jgi:hypothetical protein
MAINCKHTKCAICGGFRLKSAYVGNTKLSDICSPKCQVATKDACSCKCDGYYHKGSHKKEMDAILNPKKKVVKKKKKPVNKSTLKYLVQNFEPEGITDEIGIFLSSRKINKQSFTRFGDKNYIDKQLSRNWITNDPKGGKLDQLANEYANEYYRTGLDESDIIQRMVDFIIDNPGGIKQYIKEREKQKEIELEAYNIRQDDEYFYVPDDFDFEFPEPAPEDLFINGIKNIKMNKLKKGSPEAKRFMAKIRSMKGKTTPKKIGAKSTKITKADPKLVRKAFENPFGFQYDKNDPEVRKAIKSEVDNILKNLRSKKIGSTLKNKYYIEYMYKGLEQRKNFDTIPKEAFVKNGKYYMVAPNKITTPLLHISTNNAVREDGRNFSIMDILDKIDEGKKMGAVKLKKSPKKLSSTKTHKDTKSHNVNIRVVSGIGSYDNPEKIMQEIEYWQKQLDKLRNEYKSPKGKMYKSSITADIRLAKKFLELNKNKMKKLLVKIK